MAISFRGLGDRVGDEQVALVKSVPSVKELNLAGSNVTDAGLASLAGLSNLTHLHLEKTKIDGSGPWSSAPATPK